MISLREKNKYFINYKAIFSICFIYLDLCF